MNRARVYRNVELRQVWLGLEPFDAVSLGALAWLLMLVARDAFGWNLLILIGAYAALRVVKRGKPEGWTTTVLRFYLRRPFFSAAAPDTSLPAFALAKPQSMVPSFETSSATTSEGATE